MVDRVGDDRLRARWLAWLGLAEYMLVQDFPRALGLLDEAIAVGRRSGDVTATGYALAWKEWVLWQGGGAAEIPQVWAQLEAVLPEVADVHDRRYMTLKGLGGAAMGAMCTGDFAAVLRHAAALADLGRTSGNTRATSLGHSVLIGAYALAGDVERSVAAGEAGVEAVTDPVYEDLARIWLGFTFAYAERVDECRTVVHSSAAAANRLGMGNWNEAYDAMGAMLDMLTGHPSAATKRLASVRARSVASGNAFNVCVIDLVLAVADARIARHEAGAGLGVAIRNPRFVLGHAHSGARKAEAALTDLAGELEPRGCAGMLAAVEIELARLLAHRARHADARPHYARVVELLAALPDSPWSREAAASLSNDVGT